MFLSGKFFFIIFGIFGVTGLYFLHSYLDDTDLTKATRRWILFSVSILFCIASVFSWVYLDPGYVREDKLAYWASSSDKQVTVEVVDIIKALGKESVYVVDCSHGYGVAELPESIYQMYIGDENNVISVHVEEVTLYVSNSIIEHNFDTSTSYKIKRFSFPWEDLVQPFSDDEILEFAKLLLNRKSFLNKDNFSYDVDLFIIGSCHMNCLEYGATKFIDR